MKKVTYKTWLKNPTSRMMWVWNDKETEKEKRTVVYVFPSTKTEYKDYPILALNESKSGAVIYRHCAEIE